MSRTITAMFDTRADAEAGAARLRAAGIDASHIHVHDQSTHKTSGNYSTHQDQGTWASIKNAFLPDEDRHTYEEGMRRGGAVLTADVGDHHADEAVRALEEANSVDVDERAQSWRNEGWSYAGAGTGTGTGLGTGTGTATGLFAGRDDNDLTTRGTHDHDGTEEVIPVVEEQLVVGKREVASGGARIRSYVTEVPVHEQVRLREERVNVSRRTVDQPLSAADGDAFRERTIDMTATSEEAVIGKNARVVEEVVVSKTTGERTEEVSDTVRRTEVEVDENVGLTHDTDRTGFDNDRNR
jgi:uncharacterized protein (TIGR02271 family)